MFKQAVGLLALCCIASNAHAQPPAKIHVDSLGDPLPPGAIARLGTTRMRHANPNEQIVSSLLMHPDGKRLISTTERGYGLQGIYVWDIATGKQLPPLADSICRCRSAALSADGIYLATDYLAVWNLETCEKIAESRGDSLSIKAFAFSKKKGLVSVGRNGSVDWWELTGKKSVRSWNCFKDFKKPQELKNDVNCIARAALSPDGAVLIAHLGRARDVVGGGEARILTSFEDLLVAWEIDTGKELWRRLEKDAPVQFVFSANGKGIACWSDGGVISYRSAATGQVLATLSTENTRLEYSRPIVFSPDGKTVILGGKVFALWDLTSKKPLQEIALTGHFVPGFPSRVAAYSPDGRTIVAARDGHLQVFETASLKPRFAWEGHRDWITYLDFSSNDTLCSDLMTWNLKSGQGIRRLPTEMLGEKYRVHYTSRDQKWAIAADKNDFYFFDLVQRTKLAKIVATFPNQKVPSGSFSPLGRFFVLFDTKSGERVVIDVSTGKEVCKIPKSYNRAGIGWSPDEELIAFQTNTALIHVIETRAGKAVMNLGDATPWKFSAHSPMRFSPDGKRLANWVESMNYVEIWDLARRRVVSRMMTADREDPYCDVLLCWSPDGRMLAEVGAGGPQTIRLWEVASGKLRRELTGHAAGVNVMAFSPNGRMLASGSDDTTVLIWDVATP